MTRTDFATRRRAIVVTRKQTILAAFDAFISGLILIWFLTVTLGVMWLIFGR